MSLLLTNTHLPLGITHVYFCMFYARWRSPRLSNQLQSYNERRKNFMAGKEKNNLVQITFTICPQCKDRTAVGVFETEQGESLQEMKLWEAKMLLMRDTRDQKIRHKSIVTLCGGSVCLHEEESSDS